MNELSDRIKEVFPDRVILKDKNTYSLFEGHNLPEFIKHFILVKFSDEAGNVDESQIKEYLKTKMPSDKTLIQRRLLDGESVNMTTRISVKTALSSGKVSFSIPDLDIEAEMIIHPSVLEENTQTLIDGENWGNLTLKYVAPSENRKGYIVMTSFKSFNPYRNPDFSEFINARYQFTVSEWIDVLLSVLGYNPETFSGEEEKLAIISRMLIAVEPNLNMIELGPKSTGKSHVYNNVSKRIRMLSNRCTRAQLIYNHATKRFGALKSHDAVLFDEVSTMSFEDRDGDLNGFFKVYLEDGKASLSNISLISECGLGLIGNISLTQEMRPIDDDYTAFLPNLFRNSAMLDRFHYFIPGWKTGRLCENNIYYGWAIDKEYFSEYLHFLRSESCYKKIFEELVENIGDADIRDKKAVQKVSTAFCKLLFPHIRKLSELETEDYEMFKKLYNHYCLQPAIAGRSIIRHQCHLIDKEFKENVSEFRIKQ